MVEGAAAPRQTVGEAYPLVRQPLHADEQPAASPGAARPSFDVFVDGAPAAQIEIADAEIRALGHGQGLRQRGEQVLFDVVEDSRHAPGSSRYSRIRRPREKPSLSFNQAGGANDAGSPGLLIFGDDARLVVPEDDDELGQRLVSSAAAQLRLGVFTTACRNERKYAVALEKRAA